MIFRSDQHVVCRLFIAVPPPEIPDVHRDARRQLVLHTGRYLPVVSPGLGNLIVVTRGDHALAEGGTAQSPEFVLLRQVIAVDVAPRSSGVGRDGGRGIGDTREADEKRRLQIAAGCELDGGLAISEQIVRCSQPWRGVLPVGHVVHGRKRDVASRHVRARS